MIRACAVLCLVSLLILVLYIPASNPPDRFTTQIRLEHAAAERLWGEDAANQILERAVHMQAQAAEATPIPRNSDAPPSEALNHAVAHEMNSVNQRLFNNAYFRSVDALLLLGSYRLSSLLQWMPWLLAFAVATVVDGIFIRKRNTKELKKLDPELYAVYASLAILTISMTTVGLVVPVNLHAVLMPAVPIFVSILVGKMIVSYHP